MDMLVIKKTHCKDSVKSIIMEFLKKNEIHYNIIEDKDNEKICINLKDMTKMPKNMNYYIPFIISTSNKDVYKIYPYEIVYIAIEGRVSVIHLIEGATLKTNYNISYFDGILPDGSFARPHNSYIVNLNYVTKVTREYVYLKYKENDYSVYTSQRKISAFKKAFLNFVK